MARTAHRSPRQAQYVHGRRCRAAGEHCAGSMPTTTIRAVGHHRGRRPGLLRRQRREPARRPRARPGRVATGPPTRVTTSDRCCGCGCRVVVADPGLLPRRRPGDRPQRPTSASPGSRRHVRGARGATRLARRFGQHHHPAAPHRLRQRRALDPHRGSFRCSRGATGGPRAGGRAGRRRGRYRAGAGTPHRRQPTHRGAVGQASHPHVAGHVQSSRGWPGRTTSTPTA